MAERVSSLKTDVKYKDTPIGKIPVDWEVVPLSTISGINMGQSPPSKDCNERQDGLPFYQGNAEFGPKYPIPKQWCKVPKKIAEKGDILVGISTSGNSKNIILAVEAARNREIKSIGLLGNDGGKLASMVDLAVTVPHSVTARIQEAHIFIIHFWASCIEKELFGNN